MPTREIYIEQPVPYDNKVALTNRNPLDGLFPLENILVEQQDSRKLPIKFSCNITDEYIQNYINVRARPHFSLVHVVRLLNACLATGFTLEYQKEYGTEGSYLVYETASSHFVECFFSSAPMHHSPLPHKSILVDAMQLNVLVEPMERDVNDNIKAWRTFTMEFVAEDLASKKEILVTRFQSTAFVTPRFNKG